MTLAQSGPALELGRSYRPWRWAWSPNFDELALFTPEPDTLRFVDPHAMTVRGELPGNFGGSLTWLPYGRLLALSGKDRPPFGIYKIDPRFPRVVGYFATSRWDSSSTSPLRDGVVLLTNRGLGSHYRVTLSTRHTSREIRVRRLVPDLERWNGIAQGELGPLAATALAQSRADLSAREGIPLGEILNSAVYAKVWGHGACGRGFAVQQGHQVILEARGREFDYRVVEGRPPIFGCSPESGGPRLAEQNLLSAVAHASHVREAALAVDRARGLAFVFAPGAPVARVSLKTGRVTYRALTGLRANGLIYPETASLGSGKILLKMDQGLYLVDTRSWRLNALARSSCRWVAARGLVFVFARWSDCGGLSAYTRSGSLRYGQFFGKNVEFMGVVGRYAYVRVWNEWPFVNVLDVDSGRILNRIEFRGSFLSELSWEP